MMAEMEGEMVVGIRHHLKEVVTRLLRQMREEGVFPVAGPKVEAAGQVVEAASVEVVWVTLGASVAALESS